VPKIAIPLQGGQRRVSAVPTISPNARPDGGHAVALPTLWRCEVICLPRKLNLDAPVRQINSMGK
jgi:hypothetical protein